MLKASLEKPVSMQNQIVNFIKDENVIKEWNLKFKTYKKGNRDRECL